MAAEGYTSLNSFVEQDLLLDMLFGDLNDIVVVGACKSLITRQHKISDLPCASCLVLTHGKKRIVEILRVIAKLHQALRAKREERTDHLVLHLGFTHLGCADQLHGMGHLGNIIDTFDALFDIVKTLHRPYASRC